MRRGDTTATSSLLHLLPPLPPPPSPSSILFLLPLLLHLLPPRLFVLLCPVGPYYSTGFKPVNLLADPQYVRAWPGGCGYTKMGSNYAPTLWTQKVRRRGGGS